MRDYDRGRFVEACQAKVWFEERGDAVQAAIAGELHNGKRRYPYQCIICKLWHLTSKSQDEHKREALERMEEEFQRNTRPPRGRC